MNADSPLRVVPALVAYHTADWIQVAVASYLEHFPADRILVVDGAALVTGRMTAKVSVTGKIVHIDNRYLAVWKASSAPPS